MIPLRRPRSNEHCWSTFSSRLMLHWPGSQVTWWSVECSRTLLWESLLAQIWGRSTGTWHQVKESICTTSQENHLARQAHFCVNEMHHKEISISGICDCFFLVNFLIHGTQIFHLWSKRTTRDDYCMGCGGKMRGWGWGGAVSVLYHM